MSEITPPSPPSEDAALKAELKRALVRALRLPLEPDDIGDTTPLFGAGLGLDSIDVLEIVLELERSFGVQIRDEETGTEALQSIDTLAEFVARRRASKPG